LENALLCKAAGHVEHILSEIPRNNPKLDSMMFIRHNQVNWQGPSDIPFEPSPVWHDDAAIVTDEAAKIFLRNLLGKSKSLAKELKGEADKKRREVENAKKLRQNIREGREQKDEADAVRTILALQEDLHLVDRKRLAAEVETSTVISAVGDLSFGAKNHQFRTQTFTIPTNCDLCGDRLWGLAAKGFDCRDCGYTCHSKCEMKVPAECPGEQTKEEKKKLKAERQEAACKTPVYDQPLSPNEASELPALSRRDTMNSLSSGYSAAANRSASGLTGRKPPEEMPAEDPISTTTTKKPTPVRRNRIVAPPPAQYVSAPAPSSNEPDNVDLHPPASTDKYEMLYSWKATGHGDISVEQGCRVTIVTPDG
jgi:hypothetical protein